MPPTNLGALTVTAADFQGWPGLSPEAAAAEQVGCCLLALLIYCAWAVELWRASVRRLTCPCQ